MSTLSEKTQIICALALTIIFAVASLILSYFIFTKKNPSPLLAISLTWTAVIGIYSFCILVALMIQRKISKKKLIEAKVAC